MHGDLARIKCTHPHRPKRAARTEAGNQSGAGIIDQVGTSKSTHKSSTVGPVELGVVEQIRCLRGNFQFESLGDRERSPQGEVNVRAPGPAKEPAGLGGVSIPVLIWNNTSVRSGQRLSSESARVVFEERILLWSNGLSARQGHGRASVVPVLEGLWNLQGLAWNSIYAGSDRPATRHGNDKRYSALHGDHGTHGPTCCPGRRIH
jgi:hypothetical protein